MAYYFRINNKLAPELCRYANYFREINKAEYERLLKENKAKRVKFYVTLLPNALEEKATKQSLIQKINKCLEDFMYSINPTIILNVKS